MGENIYGWSKDESPTKAENEEGRGPEKEKRWRVGLPIP